MAKLVIVENDKVEGTDKHTVSGDATNPSAPPPTISYKGIADFDYVGRMTKALSEFVKIDGIPVALISSQSSLDAGQETVPSGKHSGPQGSNFVPSIPAPIPLTLSIDDSIGVGDPGALAGSSFVRSDGDALLLDGDPIDTCDGLSIPGNSSVAAENQDFVTCST